MCEIGPYQTGKVVQGDCLQLAALLPDESIDIIVTSPPYWGQRLSLGTGVESDPRLYLQALVNIFTLLLRKLKPRGLLWINVGDAYNTPVNWDADDSWTYSSLGAQKDGLSPANSAHTKARSRRRAFIDKAIPWLKYGNLLALPYRMVVDLCTVGYLFRGEVIWRKLNPMPEGKCRRPHRGHESIYLFAKQENHAFRISPPVRSVWDLSNEKIDGLPHSSRYPVALPLQCIEAYGALGPEVIVLDPFSGSGSTGIAASRAGCSYIGFEIDPRHVEASNQRLTSAGEDVFAVLAQLDP